MTPGRPMPPQPEEHDESEHHDQGRITVTRRQVIQSVIGFALAGALIYWGLPLIAQTTWPKIIADLQRVPLWVALVLTLMMLLGLYSYTFTFVGSLPGLTHGRALTVNLAGSMVSNVLPGGGAVGVAVTYLMCRTWGFNRRNISTSMVVTAVWNTLARLLLPVLGILAVLISPVTLPSAVTTGALIGSLAAIGLLVLFIAVLVSERFSQLVGGLVGRLASPFSSRVRDAGGDVSSLVRDLRARIATVVRTGGVMMTLGIVGMFTMFFFVFWMCAWAVGLDLPVTQLFTAYAVRQFLTAVTVTPGGLGVTEAGAMTVLIAAGGDSNAAAATAILFALFTQILEIPLGIGAWISWALGSKRNTAEQLGTEDLDIEVAPDDPLVGDDSDDGHPPTTPRPPP